MEGEDDQEFKIVLVGNAATGKTSIINRLIKKSFNEHNPTTVGAMFLTHRVEIEGKGYKLQIWDTAGQERLRAIAPLYYRDAQGVILVYDTTSLPSFEGLDSWFHDLNEKGSERTCTVVVGNKIDLIDEQRVNNEEASLFAAKKNSTLLLASAKDGRGIEEAVVTLVKRIVSQKFNEAPIGADGRGGTPTRLNSQTIVKKPIEQKKKCC